MQDLDSRILKAHQSHLQRSGIDGIERSTIQYAKDGVNFEIASTVQLVPHAGAPFVPDAFTDTDYGRGISWGLCFGYARENKKSPVLMRFDCDLSLDVHDPEMKLRPDTHKAAFYYRHGLDEDQNRSSIRLVLFGNLPPQLFVCPINALSLLFV